MPGLRVGSSFYYCANTLANSDEPSTYSDISAAPLRIYSVDAQYKNRYVTVRGNFLTGNLTHASAIAQANRYLNNASGYSRLSPIAKKARQYAVEAGINLRSICGGNEKVPVIYPYARYEYYNPQQEGELGIAMEPRNQVSMWMAGLNWFALPNLVVKADYTTRKIGTSKVFGGGRYNRENEFAIGVAYVGWFFKK